MIWLEFVRAWQTRWSSPVSAVNAGWKVDLAHGKE